MRHPFGEAEGGLPGFLILGIYVDQGVPDAE
jgi:hypothetical protein